MESYKTIDIGFGFIFIEKYSWDIRIDCHAIDGRFSPYRCVIQPKLYDDLIRITEKAYHIYETLNEAKSDRLYAEVRLFSNNSNNGFLIDGNGIKFITAYNCREYFSKYLNSNELLKNLQNAIKTIRDIQDKM